MLLSTVISAQCEDHDEQRNEFRFKILNRFFALPYDICAIFEIHCYHFKKAFKKLQSY